MIEIYGRPTAWNVRKVLFLMESLQLPYKRLDYGRGYAPTNTPEFLALNPNGMVPVLVEDGLVLWESHTILRYLAAKYGPPSLYPADLRDRALVDQWLDWKIAHVSPAIRPLFFTHFLKTGDFSDREVADAEAECARLFTILDAQLAKTGAYATGPELTIADCALGMAVHRWLSLPVQKPALEHIHRYYRQLSQLPSYQKTILIGMP
jgi:glutathione S-transferase